MSDLILVVESPDGRVLERPLAGLETIGAEAGAAYALIDAATGMPAEGLELKREGEDLDVEVNQETVVHIDDFYAQDLDATFSVDGPALSVEPLASEAPDAVNAAIAAHLADVSGQPR